MIHKDHVSAVMDVSFSPTGQEFASGSYDRTVRVFPHRSGRSREVYHTKRMQRVFCVNFSADARCVVYVGDLLFSGSRCTYKRCPSLGKV